MPSFRQASPLAAIFLVSLLAGCGSDGGGGGPDGLAVQAKEIFPAGTAENEAVGLSDQLEAAAAAGDNATADERAFSLATLTLGEFQAGRLEGGAGLPASLSSFLKDVFATAGLGTPPLSPSSFGNEGIVAVVEATGGTFTTQTLHAGIDIPAGALSRPALLVADRLPDASAHSPTDGPLPTSLDQYPLFYEFTFTPVITLAADAIIGVCQVTESSSPYYAPDDVFNRLQLAHPDPSDPSAIELLERVEAPFLDCDGVGPSTLRGASLLARRPGIGGRVRNFSPFAAVDPETPAQGAAGIYVTNAADNSIRVFALDATGNAAPVRVIKGASTQLSLPIGIGMDTQGNLYVANRTGAKVTMYPQTATGDVAPSRTLTNGAEWSPQVIDVGPGDELLVGTCPNCGSAAGGATGVFHFASGATTSDYSIDGGNTVLSVPSGIDRDASGNIIVSNAFGGTVNVYAPGSTGNVAPIRSFTPSTANTQAMSVGGNTIALSSPGTGIALFPLTATGATAPTATIGAPAVPISYPGGVLLDAGVTPPVIYLVDYSGNAIYVIQTAGVAPNLTVSSVRTIKGAATGLGQPLGIAVVK